MAADVVAEALAPWLARPCASSLHWYTNGVGGEEILAYHLPDARSLKVLHLQVRSFQSPRNASC